MKSGKESSWEKRNNLEKILIVIITFLLCFVLSIFIVLTLHFVGVFKNDAQEISPCRTFENIETINAKSIKAKSCLTPACIKVSAQIIDFVNTSVDPCDNFYDFTCSIFNKRWRETNRLFGLSMVEKIIENRINALITEPIINKQLPKELDLQRRFYDSCMNTTAIDEDQNDAFLTLLEKIGGWPIRKGRYWNSRKFNWLTAIINCRKMGIEFNFLLNVTKKQMTVNGTELMLLSISPPVPTILPSYFRNDYVELMTNVSLKLGAYSYNYAKEESLRVLQFEDQLKTLSINEEGNLIQVKTLQEKIPNIPWIEFLNNISRTSQLFTKNSWIDFHAMKYLQDLSNLLDNTTKRIQANYIIWKILENHRYYLSEELRRQYDTFLIDVNSTLLKKDRKSFCLNQAKLYFPSVAEIAYVKNYIQKQNISQMKQISENIKEKIQDEIETSDWLDESFKKIVTAKLTQVDEDIKVFQQMFSEDFDYGVDMFSVNVDNIIEMDSELSSRKMDNYFKNVNKPVDHVRKPSILNINPVNEHNHKALVLYTLFQEKLSYDFQSPFYVIYGSIGYAISQEYSRLVFQQYRVNKTNMPASNNFTRILEEKSKCLLERHKVLKNGEMVDPSKYFDNFVIDLTAVELVHKVYEEWVEKNGQEQTLPGIIYDQNQIFWITFGLSQCYQNADNYNYLYSVINSLRNSTDFAAAFNCPILKMNQKKKCWIL